MRPILIGVAVILVTAVLTVPPAVEADHGGSIYYQKRNAWDHYRWPWTFNQHWRITQGWDGDVSHHGSLYYAVDFSKTGGGGSQPIAAARDGVATCQDLSSGGLGVVVRITHGSDSHLYAHQNTCYLTSPGTFVAQGRTIGYTGTFGYKQGDTADHLHFQVNTTTTGHVSKAFTMEGVSNFNHSTVYNRWADSDNLSAGYSTPPITWTPAIHAKYQARGGWDIVGSTAALPAGWQPGRYSGCSPTPGVYSCTSNGRSGLIQTFKGWTGVQGQVGYHAIFRGNGLNAVFMSRAALGGFTDSWDGFGRDGLWYLGYPFNDSAHIGGGVYRMYHENGYWDHTPSNCQTKFYYWEAFIGAYIHQHTSFYCD